MPLDSVPLDLATLPGIVAGPILRRLTRTEVSIWVACVASDPITVEVSRHAAGGLPATSVTVQPTQVGINLWMAVLTVGAPGGTFVAGQIYQYLLKAAWEDPSLPNGRGPIDWPALSLAPGILPTFLAPPATAAELVVYHTSCRRPDAGGRDALGLAIEDVARRFAPPPSPPQLPPPQPHLLVLSGDQIYADEVGHPLMPRIVRVAQDLVGIDERTIFGPVPPIGGRGPGTDALGFTGARANHLWTYGEFLAMYLLVWSPVPWPAVLPPFPTNPPLGPPDVDPGIDQESWDAALLDVGLLRAGLPEVRRLLANVPTLMIFDDHEITDDWNIDHAWVSSVYAKAGGRRAVTNGLLAYTLCQHWGNKPRAFTTSGSAERRVLNAVSTAVATRTSPADACRPLLGVPAGALPAAPPAQALRDLSVAGAIRYDLTLGPAEGWPVRIVLLDERTAREYPRSTGRGARISRAALAAQLPPPAPAVPLTIVVAATPIFGSDLLEHVLQPLFDLIFADGARAADFESWSAARAHHQDLLARLAAHHPVVVLSGDVHYGFTSRITRTEAGRTTRVAQLTASAAKNVETKNTAISIFSELIMRLGLERVREVSGFASLSNADKAKLLAAPAAGTSLPWDETVDILLGRVSRDGVEAPTSIPTAVARAYGLTTPGWTYVVEPVDDPMTSYAAPVVSAPWAGWNPDRSLTMCDALQQADCERFARMFVGLPQVGVVTFTSTGTSLTVRHELRCPVGIVESGPAATNRHLLRTEVVLT